MRAARLWPWLVMVCGCLNPTEIGVQPAPPDAGPDPLARLHARMQGRWCGTAAFEFIDQEICLSFDAETYTVECDCAQPFPGESVVDGSTGRYALTDYSLNGEGWGRAEHPLPGGATSQLRLEHIQVTDDTLRFERSPERSLRRVVVMLSRSD